MSIIKTVQYEINEDGDCEKCESNIESVCGAFKIGLKVRSISTIISHSWVDIQCQSCKDFIAEEKAKVYCDGCKNLNQFAIEHIPKSSKCKIGNKIISHKYSLNCQDRSE